jgi:molecular chaperone HtpG
VADSWFGLTVALPRTTETTIVAAAATGWCCALQRTDRMPRRQGNDEWGTARGTHAVPALASRALFAPTAVGQLVAMRLAVRLAHGLSLVWGDQTQAAWLALHPSMIESGRSGMSESQSGDQSYAFQAEVSELLHLMVRSVYSETDIFLRELISNASDACDKLRYEAIGKPELLGEGGRLVIQIKPDATARTLTIADTGIGMDRQELIDNLGTIARSGTRAFMSRLRETKDGAGLIGQFGVGFYSAFMVADKIEVISRRAGAAEVWIWRAAGGEGFEIARALPEQATRMAHGTEVVLHLKEDAKRYLENHEIERVVRMYSDHILFPIELLAGAGEPRQINEASALWQRAKSEIKPDEYKKAYQMISGAFDEPALTLHYKAEGRLSYAVLLFTPSSRPFDLFGPERKGQIKLYVRRVYITDDAELLPPYLRFVRGVIDSEDLPLNISREMLQNNPQVAQIRKSVSSRLLAELGSLASNDATAFGKLWDAFGSVLKEGIYEDSERRDQLLALARFATTKDAGLRSLQDYVAAMQTGQAAIYYLAGDSIDRLKSNPKLEAARARDIEVLLLTDPIDAFWTSLSLSFDGKPLKSLSQGDVDFGETQPPPKAANGEPATTAVDTAVIIAAIKGVLAERISEVRASNRLVDSAACLVASGQGPDRELQRLLSLQRRDVGSKPILEINTSHPLVKGISEARLRASDDLADLCELLFDQAVILDGDVPEDPAAFTKRMNRFVVRGLPSTPKPPSP